MLLGINIFYLRPLRMCMHVCVTDFHFCLQLINIGAASKAATFCARNNYISPQLVFVPSTCVNNQVVNGHP